MAEDWPRDPHDVAELVAERRRQQETVNNWGLAPIIHSGRMPAPRPSSRPSSVTAGLDVMKSGTRFASFAACAVCDRGGPWIGIDTLTGWITCPACTADLARYSRGLDRVLA